MDFDRGPYRMRNGCDAWVYEITAFRLKDSTDTTCHMQGSVTATGGGGQMELDNVVIAASQAITYSTFTLTAPNA